MNQRKSVVIPTRFDCVKCLKCIKACPTSALHMDHGRIIVDDTRCINCAKCISTCNTKGLVAKGSSLIELENYDYTVCMVPSSITSSCSNKEDAQRLFYAIKTLGFDEVVDLSPVEGQMMKETYMMSQQFKENTIVASFCPVVNQLIEINYPMLLDNIAPLEYPHEVMAKHIRMSRAAYGNVGIFNLCECEAKLAIAKYPYGNFNYETDHAIASVDYFARIKSNMHLGKMDLDFCREGLQAINPYAMLNKEGTLIADGFEKINDILGLEEFERLQPYHLFYLFPCFNGCLGGHLVWGSSYLTKNNIHALTKDAFIEPMKLPASYIYNDDVCKTKEDTRSFQERVAFYQRVNAVLDELPGYDCSACGLQTCRRMAEEIVKKNRTLNDCQIKVAMMKEDSDEDQ